MGFVDGKACFVWNALPGEELEIEITKNKKTHLEAIATKIFKPSTDRIEPKEDHFLSCSSWQIMNFAAENRWKKNIAVETYKKLGGIDAGDLEIIGGAILLVNHRRIDCSVKGALSALLRACLEPLA